MAETFGRDDYSAEEGGAEPADETQLAAEAVEADAQAVLTSSPALSPRRSKSCLSSFCSSLFTSG